MLKKLIYDLKYQYNFFVILPILSHLKYYLNSLLSVIIRLNYKKVRLTCYNLIQLVYIELQTKYK